MCINSDNRWIICPLPTQPEPSSSSDYSWRRVPVLNIPLRRSRIGFFERVCPFLRSLMWARFLINHSFGNKELLTASWRSFQTWFRAPAHTRGTSLEVIGASCLSLIAGRAHRRRSRFKYAVNFHPMIRLPSAVDGGRGRSAFFRGGDCGDRPHKILVGPVCPWYFSLTTT